MQLTLGNNSQFQISCSFRSLFLTYGYLANPASYSSTSFAFIDPNALSNNQSPLSHSYQSLAKGRGSPAIATLSSKHFGEDELQCVDMKFPNCARANQGKAYGGATMGRVKIPSSLSITVSVPKPFLKSIFYSNQFNFPSTVESR